MPRTFVFDAYGTLFDVHAAIGRHRAAAGPDADRFSEIWRTKQLEYTWTLTLAGRYVDFWTLTQRALDYSFARVPSVDRALRPALLDAYMTLDAFADARAVLKSLKAGGHITAILSNGSPPMLDAAVDGCRDRRASRCRAVGRRDPHLQAAARGLCAGHRALQARAARRRLRLVEPLGRGGRAGLRLPHRLGQSRRHAGRICRVQARHGRARPHRARCAFRSRLRRVAVRMPRPYDCRQQI